MVYKFSRNGNVFLESESKDVAANQDSGEIVPTDYYWTTGMSDWLLVGSKSDWEPALPPPLSSAPSQPVRALGGRVLDFNQATFSGLILGDDGVRYGFNAMEWRNASMRPAQGLQVNFEAKGAQAFSIYPTALPSTLPRPAAALPPGSLAPRPFAYYAWMVAAFFAPYLFGWRIIFDKTLGYSKEWKILYALWLPLFVPFVLEMTNGSRNFSSPRDNSSFTRTENLESKNAAFMARLTPEQRIAVETMQKNFRQAVRENFDHQDKNKDERLDMKEFLSQPLYGINTYGAEDFDSRDTNKDGYVTFEEQMQK
jgi:hypothetical protein